MLKRGRNRLKISLAVLWSIFTPTLAIWWLIFSLRQIKRVGELSPQELARQEQMLLWEGGVLIVLLVVGGAFLVFYMIKEMKANDKLLLLSRSFKL